MIIEIGGYYSDDRHIVNIDKVETVSMQKERMNTSSDNYELVVLMSNQTLFIRFLSYKDRCEIEYTKLLDALRHRDGELKICSKGDDKN